MSIDDRTPSGHERDVALASTQAASSSEEPSVAFGAAIADARPTTNAGVLLAQAAAAARLFGDIAPRILGRFRVLDRIGQGGMGVVYAAYDPTLDRAVALKLVPVPARGQDAALAEAKALARLSHPNVVPVHDIGIEADQLYIVMELVRGPTLRSWVKDRATREIVDAYRQAGQALGAAHAVGLVHRDFKPDNAIMGTDGRVRVVDFGLACAVSDEIMSPAGTQRYMAPEQTARAALTPAADQYSFCVSLEEALGAGPLPRWLATILERGRSAHANERFESMPALLRALARDPARVWRVRAAAAIATIACTSAFVVGRASSTEELVDACDAGEAELAAQWSAFERAATVARVAGMSPYGRELAPRLTSALDEFSSRWTAGHREACEAHRRGAQSDALFDRRMACLARQRGGLAAIEEIATGVDARGLADLAQAVRALPDPDACADATALLADVDPPRPARARDVANLRTELERTKILIAGGQLQNAHERAAASVARARTVEYPPVLAEALLVQGFARMQMPGRAEAVSALAEAAKIALEAGADTLGVEAWARRAWAEGTTGDPAAALRSLDVIEAIAARATTGKFARALLYNNVGSVELGRSELARARAAFERAREEARGLTGEGAAELVVIHSNLAIAVPDWATRDTLNAETIATLAQLYGKDHPKTLWLRWTQARVSRDLAVGIDRLVGVCEQYEAQGGYRVFAARCFTDLGLLRYEVGDDAGAVAALERAARLDATGNDTEAGPHLLLFRGDAGGAARELAVRVAAFPEIPAHATWMRFARGRLELALGRARRAAGQLAEARVALEASVADLEAATAEHWGGHFVTRARTELAHTLAALQAPANTVAPVAAAAHAWLSVAGARSDDVRAMQRLAHRRVR